MRLVKLGPNGPWAESYDIDCCQNPACGQLFGPGRFAIGWLNCKCASDDGHRTFKCRACGTTSYDPRHDETRVITGGDRYSAGS